MTDKVELNSPKGEETINALMAKMTPEQQEQFKASLQGDKPVHVHVDKDGKIVLGDAADEAAPSKEATEAVQAAPEDPVELKKDEPKKPSKIDQKRQQIFMDRLKRHMGKGLTQQQAVQAIQMEDYAAMPLDKKFANLERIVAQTFRNLSNDIMNLSQGHMAIGDAFDINYRAIQKVFIKLGISNEEQKVFIDEAQKEVIEARKKDMEMRAEAGREVLQEKQAEAEADIKAELSKPPSALGTEAAEGAEIPKEATVFGG